MKFVTFACCTYCAFDHENVAIVTICVQIFGDIGKIVEIITVLARTEDVPDLMFADNSLKYEAKDSMHFHWVFLIRAR